MAFNAIIGACLGTFVIRSGFSLYGDRPATWAALAGGVLFIIFSLASQTSRPRYIAMTALVWAASAVAAMLGVFLLASPFWGGVVVKTSSQYDAWMQVAFLVGAAVFGVLGAAIWKWLNPYLAKA